jgi:hypothetical protein
LALTHWMMHLVRWAAERTSLSDGSSHQSASPGPLCFEAKPADPGRPASAANPPALELRTLPWLCLAAEMFRSPAAALLRRLAPRLSGGTVGSASSARRTLPPHIAPSVLARFSSTPTSSPPPSSSAGERDDEAEDHELQGAPGSSGARLSISVDRSGLCSPPGRTPLTRTHSHKCMFVCMGSL